MEECALTVLVCRATGRRSAFDPLRTLASLGDSLSDEQQTESEALASARRITLGSDRHEIEASKFAGMAAFVLRRDIDVKEIVEWQDEWNAPGATEPGETMGSQMPALR